VTDGAGRGAWQDAKTSITNWTSFEKIAIDDAAGWLLKD
jgi:hypothetical protein